MIYRTFRKFNYNAIFWALLLYSVALGKYFFYNFPICQYDNLGITQLLFTDYQLFIKMLSTILTISYAIWLHIFLNKIKLLRKENLMIILIFPLSIVIISPIYSSAYLTLIFYILSLQLTTKIDNEKANYYIFLSGFFTSIMLIFSISYSFIWVSMLIIAIFQQKGFQKSILFITGGFVAILLYFEIIAFKHIPEIKTAFSKFNLILVQSSIYMSLWQKIILYLWAVIFFAVIIRVLLDMNSMLLRKRIFFLRLIFISLLLLTGFSITKNYGLLLANQVNFAIFLTYFFSENQGFITKVMFYLYIISAIAFNYL